MNGQAAHSGIAIAVGLTDRRITRLIIENHRILNATMPLVGLTPQDALSAIHRLFAICRMAQGVAGVTAIEDAGGLVVSSQQKAARRLLVAGETLLEQATQAALRWPLLMQDPPDFEGLKGLRLALSGLSQALYPDGDWLRVGGGRLTPDRVALAQALAMARRAVARLAIAQGQPVGAAARLLDRVIGQGLAGFGKTQLGFLPDLPAIPLAQILDEDQEGAFVARPVWQGQSFGTGALARRADDAEVTAVIVHHGRGLLAHLTACLAEIDHCLGEMGDIINGLCDSDTGLEGSMLTEGRGIAMLEAARGRLVHRVQLQQGKLFRYQILAPTEWNFHPAGVLVEGTEGWRLEDEEAFALRLLVTAMDPCVSFSLRVFDA